MGVPKGTPPMVHPANMRQGHVSGLASSKEWHDQAARAAANGPADAGFAVEGKGKRIAVLHGPEERPLTWVLVQV